MRYLLIIFGLFVSFFGNAQNQGVPNAQTKLRPNQIRWSPTDATLDSVYIIRANTVTGEPGWYLVTLSGGSIQDTTISGDVIGGLNSTFVRKINGVTVENKTPQNREVLQYNGTQWTPDSIDLADLPTLAQNVLLGRGSASTGSPQSISLGTGLSMSGTTLSNSSPDQTVLFTSGTGISATGTYPNFTVTNTSPDQTVSITGGGINAITGTYPNFTVTGTEVDGSISNEGSLTVGAGTDSTSIINSNTSGSTGVTLTASTGLTIGETGNVITLTNSAPDQTVSISGATGTYPNFTVTPTTPGGSSTQLQYNNSGAFAGSSQLVANIGATNTLDITGSGNTSSTNALRVRNSSGTDLFSVRNDGLISSGAIIIPSAPKAGQFETVGSILSGAYSSLGNVNGGYGMVGSNYYVNSSNSLVRKVSDLVSMIEFSDGFQFQTSGVGAEGSSISRTTRAKITSSGLFGLNIATPLAGFHNGINTTASTPSMLLSGTGYAGGTNTTTKPTLLIEPTGTTSTGWNVNGTKLGVNAESGFTGNLLGLQVNGTSKFKVDYTGKLTSTSDIINLATAKTPSSASDTGTTGDIAWDSNYIYVCVATNTWKRTAISTW